MKSYEPILCSKKADYMSIIYDALKKVENKLEESKTHDMRIVLFAKKNLPIKIFILFLAVLSLGFFMAKALFSFGFAQKSIPAASLPAPINTSRAPKQQVINIPQELNEKSASIEPGVSAPSQNKASDLSSLVLNGIFFSGQEGYALINNQILKEGDVIEGAKITRITLEGVELESGALKTELPINKK